VEQTGYQVVLKPDPQGGYVAVVPAFRGCYSQGETENTPGPDEFSAEEEALDCEGEGWS
jgi:hypothetical protein